MERMFTQDGADHPISGVAPSALNISFRGAHYPMNSLSPRRPLSGWCTAYCFNIHGMGSLPIELPRRETLVDPSNSYPQYASSDPCSFSSSRMTEALLIPRPGSITDAGHGYLHTLAAGGKEGSDPSHARAPHPIDRSSRPSSHRLVEIFISSSVAHPEGAPSTVLTVILNVVPPKPDSCRNILYVS
ncbi:hypothetical protein EVG20_g6624 [Dentipellis fragilis]|uniref:Uncharacterized protein n=1 Tax=Dentipellis fragilis TaxID=205917 RepID=A0A4Y9YJV7_9AGAM|nr:hypothetical protein EVG20_g6624 [Dentipellis fragilis]